MRKLLMILSVCCFVMTGMAAPVVLDVPVPDGDATPVLRRAIEQASSYKGRAVLIRLQQGDYHIYRTSSSPYLYYISNTASAEENPDPTKHIGIWLKDMKNITVDGGGARFVTHGEMTPFVIDGCENVTMKNFSLVAADPSVPEMTVVSTDVNSITARVTAGSNYEIEDGTFYWKGEGWRFGGGIAQVFYPQTNVTNRCESPLTGVTKAIELDEGLVRFNYDRTPGFKTGEVYQMRHSFRTEACGFIHQSKDVKLENIKFHFLGNFGIVGQYSENKYFEKIGKTVKEATDEIPFEIPTTWQWVRIKDIFQINPKNIAEENCISAFIPMEKICATYGSEFSYDEVQWKAIKAGYTHFADGDVAFAKITPCFQNRKSAIFCNLPNGIGAGTTELKVLRQFGETINRWYLLFFLESPYFIDEAIFKGTANQQRIISGYLENKLFPLPPLQEQTRIEKQIKAIASIMRG